MCYVAIDSEWDEDEDDVKVTQDKDEYLMVMLHLDSFLIFFGAYTFCYNHQSKS